MRESGCTQCTPWPQDFPQLQAQTGETIVLSTTSKVPFSQLEEADVVLSPAFLSSLVRRSCDTIDRRDCANYEVVMGTLSPYQLKKIDLRSQRPWS
jgi:hypothetical protein